MGATEVGAAVTAMNLVTVAPVAISGLLGMWGAQMPWKKRTASEMTVSVSPWA